MFIKAKDWNEKEQSVRKCRKTENIDTQRELEKLREQLNKLQLHISKALVEEHNLDAFETPKDKQEWLQFVIDSFYDPSVKLVRDKALTFDEFAKVFVEIRSKEENRMANSILLEVVNNALRSVAEQMTMTMVKLLLDL